MPSRKKAKGKARKAAKAKEEKSRAVAAGQRQEESVEAQLQGLQISRRFTYVYCNHDWPLLSVGEEKIYIKFIETFTDEFASKGLIGMLEAHKATKEKYPSMYPSKLNTVVSMALSYGAQLILEGDNHTAGLYAVLAFYFENYLAVTVHKTKGAPSSKLLELENADDHTLVSYYRKRIPCSCLDEKYKEVKSMKKMGWCFNPNCSHPGGMVERSKMLCCTRCGYANYCSVECQRASWKEHKKNCNKTVERRAAFNADQS